MNRAEDYGRYSGYNQIAPGRDVAWWEEAGRPGRPRRQPQGPVQQAITEQPQPASQQVIQQAIGAPVFDPTGQQTTPIEQANPALAGGRIGDVASRFGGNGGFAGGMRPQVQDQWGRPPSHPEYGKPPAETAPAGIPAPAATERQRASYSLGFSGFDPAKGTAEHAMKSPKYAFFNAMNTGQYGTDQLGAALADLQKSHPDFYKGWELLPGKEVIRYTGAPGSQHQSWNGVDEVDLMVNAQLDPNAQGFDPSKSQWWWGTSTPEERAEKAARGSGRASAPAGGGMMSAILGQVMGGETQESYTERMRKQIMDSLNVDPRLASIGQMYRS